MERKIIVGKKYRHFKGMIIRVMGIGTHTETKEKMVIYQHADGTGEVWIRPLDMFNSDVDHAKYPNVKQKYRFEELKAETAPNKRPTSNKNANRGRR